MGKFRESYSGLCTHSALLAITQLAERPNIAITAPSNGDAKTGEDIASMVNMVRQSLGQSVPAL
jgi:hypothetical protein